MIEPKSRNPIALLSEELVEATSGVLASACESKESFDVKHCTSAENSAAAASPDKAPTRPELSKCLRWDAELLKQLGWKKFVLQCHIKSDFMLLDNVDYPAKRLLGHYKN